MRYAMNNLERRLLAFRNRGVCVKGAIEEGESNLKIMCKIICI